MLAAAVVWYHMHRWIWGVIHMLVTKHESEGIHCGFETQDWHINVQNKGLNGSTKRSYIIRNILKVLVCKVSLQREGILVYIWRIYMKHSHYCTSMNWLGMVKSSKSKVNWCTKKSGIKDPSINTCQDSSDGKGAVRHKFDGLNTLYEEYSVLTGPEIDL